MAGSSTRLNTGTQSRSAQSGKANRRTPSSQSEDRSRTSPGSRPGSNLPPAEIAVADFVAWSEGASFPLLPTERSLDIFRTLRAHPRLDNGGDWIARPHTELHATNDKKHMILAPESTDGLWPVFKGASFNIWVADTGEHYAWADPDFITGFLQKKRENARSAFNGFTREWINDPATLPCRSPRIAFRDVARATDTRTVLAALIPPDVVITNKGPFLLWPQGDERDQAYLLGVLCSIPLDWYARRWVEISLNFHIFNAFPIPRPDRADPLRRRIEEVSGTLAAVDDRYGGWAEAVGVSVGGVKHGDQRDDSRRRARRPGRTALRPGRGRRESHLRDVPRGLGLHATPPRRSHPLPIAR